MSEEEFPFVIKPELFVCDNYQTHDLLWVKNVGGRIQSLIDDSFQGHFPSIENIALIERYAPQNGFNYAKDWTIKVFRLYENLGKTGIIDNDALTGRLYFDDAPYQPNKLPVSLGFTAIPDKLRIKVNTFAKVSFYERTHDEEAGKLEYVNQSVSIWWRKELSFVQGEFDIDISKLLFNSLIIEGDYFLISPSNELLFYSNLDATINKIINLLPTPKILNFWDSTVNSNSGGDAYLHFYRDVSRSNPNYIDVPDCYSYSCFISANNDVWNEGNNVADMGKEITVRINFNKINLYLWKTLENGISYTGNIDFKLDLPYANVGINDVSNYLNTGTNERLSGYNLFREYSTERDYTLEWIVSVNQYFSFSIRFAGNRKVYLANIYDDTIENFLSLGVNWFGFYQYATMAVPKYTYYKQLEPQVGYYAIGVGYPFFNGLNKTFSYNPAFVTLHNSPEMETNLIQGTTVPFLWHGNVLEDDIWTYQNKSRIYQFNNIFSDHSTTVVSHTDTVGIEGNSTYHLTRDFYFTALPSIPSSSTQEIKSYIENLPQKDKDIEWSFIEKTDSDSISVSGGKGVILFESKNITLAKNAWVGFLGKFTVSINGSQYSVDYNQFYIDNNNSLQEVNFMNVDSPRLKAIYAAFNAEQYCKNPISPGQERRWNLGAMIHAIAVSQGLNLNANGEIMAPDNPVFYQDGDDVYNRYGDGQAGIAWNDKDAKGNTYGEPTPFVGYTYDVMTPQLGVNQFSGEMSDILTGGMVGCPNIPQVLDSFKRDVMKTLGGDESVGVVPSADGKTYSLYTGIADMLNELLYMGSYHSLLEMKNLVNTQKAVGMGEEILKGMGVSLDPKQFQMILEGTPVKGIYPGIASSSPTIADLILLGLLQSAYLMPHTMSQPTPAKPEGTT